MENIIYKYFPNLSGDQKGQFERLGPLYKDWNKKINVISRKDIDNLYLHHILHSLAIAKIIDFKPGTRITDIGTGGGFPGLPLAIMCPDVKFLLVDSIGKKLKVVETVCQAIGIKNVNILQARVEDVTGQFDFAVCRAVARLDTTWRWIKDKISYTNINDLDNGLLYLKGGDISKEIPKNVNIKSWQLSNFFEEKYFETKQLILVSKKRKELAL